MTLATLDVRDGPDDLPFWIALGLVGAVLVLWLLARLMILPRSSQ